MNCVDAGIIQRIFDIFKKEELVKCLKWTITVDTTQFLLKFNQVWYNSYDDFNKAELIFLTFFT